MAQKEKYKLTPEHEAMLPAWRDRWIDIILRTSPMTDDERHGCRNAVEEMYKIIDHAPPRVVFVSSPFIAAAVAGIAAAYWAAKKKNSEEKILAALSEIRDLEIVNATLASTIGTDRASICSKNEHTPPPENYYRGVDISLIKRVASAFGVKPIAPKDLWLWQGGNMSGAFESYLSFFQDVAKLDIDYTKYIPWRYLAEHSGPRFVHEQFCVISDFPEFIKRDDQNRPHAENGPFLQWRDGSAIYSWHGTYVPGRWLEGQKPSAKEALKNNNMETRRAACEIVGWDNVLEELGAVVIDEDVDPQIGTLVEVSLPDAGYEKFLRVKCGTGRKFAISVPRDMKTAKEANAWTYGLTPEDYTVEVRT